MRRPALYTAALVVLGLGCASTQVGTTWTKPSLRTDQLPRRVLVAADAPTLGVENGLEQTVAGELRAAGIAATPMAAVEAPEQLETPEALPPGSGGSGGQPAEPNALEEALQGGEFDGLLVSRVVRVTADENYPLGYYGPYGYWGYPAYRGYWGYWGAPVTESTHIETTLYRVENGQREAVWTTTSRTRQSGGYGTEMSDQDIARFGKVIAGRFASDLLGS